MDQIEKRLEEMSKALTEAWKQTRCLQAACPLGDCAAQMAALLQFYRESKKRPERHWTDRAPGAYQ